MNLCSGTNKWENNIWNQKSYWISKLAHLPWHWSFCKPLHVLKTKSGSNFGAEIISMLQHLCIHGFGKQNYEYRELSVLVYKMFMWQNSIFSLSSYILLSLSSVIPAREDLVKKWKEDSCGQGIPQSGWGLGTLTICTYFSAFSLKM